MRKNVAGQTVSAQLVSKTDGSNVTSGTTTVYVTGDNGTQTAGSGTVAHKGGGEWSYVPTQAETNFSHVKFTFTNATAIPHGINIYPVGYDPTLANLPANVTQFGGSAGTFASGRPEVNASHVGGTSQTGRDIGASVLLSSGTGTGQVQLSSGVVRANDSSGNAIAPAATALSNVQWTNAKAGYLDNLNIGGTVASQADITAINQSASRRIVLATLAHYERPESGSSAYTVEARTYDGDGAAVNADSTPSLTATGGTSGDLAANLGSATNPATGVYRWTYTVASNATLEQIRFDISATIGAATFTISAYTQACDLVSATFTSSDRSMITAVYNKIPSKPYLAGSNNSDGDIQLDEATGTPTWATSLLNRVGSFTGSGTNTILGFFQSLFRKNVSAPSDAGGNYDPATDSLEAIRDNMGSAQTGDAYAVVNSGTHGNAVIQSLAAAVKTVTDKVNDTLENNAGTYRFTEAALAEAPAGAGGGGGTDWSADERATFKAILGIPVSGTTPVAPSTGVLATIAAYLDTEIAAIKAKTDGLPTDPADASDIAGAFAAVVSALNTLASYVDTEVAAIKAKTDILPASFPSNFPSLAITPAGKVATATNDDKTGYSLTTAPPTAAQIADEIESRGGPWVESTVQASPTPTTTVFTGGSEIQSGSNYYAGCFVAFESGALKGISRPIASQSGRALTLASALPAAPAAGTAFSIQGFVEDDS